MNIIRQVLIKGSALLVAIILIDDINGFNVIIPKNERVSFVHNNRGWFWTSNTERISKTTSINMDPYEYQYQQYFQSSNNINDATTASITNQEDITTTEDQQQQPLHDTSSEHFQDQFAYEPVNLQENEYTTTTTTSMQQSSAINQEEIHNIAKDSYEYQYQQYFQKASNADIAQQAITETTINDSTSNTAYNDNDIDSYITMQEVEHNTNTKPFILSPEEESILESKRKLDEEEQFLRMVSNEVEVKKLIGQNPYAVTDIDFDTVRQRILDNLEDDTQKRNGKVKGKSNLKLRSEPKEIRKTVIVLGTGWAAHAFIKLASTYDLRIVVVSPVNHFVFTPMLASAAVGTIEYRSMTEPIRVTNPFIDNYVEGRAVGVDVENRVLTVQTTPLATVTGSFRGVAANDKCRLEPDEQATNSNNDNASKIIQLNYDYLICAVGTCVRSTIVPGAKEHCFNLKTSQDSKRLRTAIGEALEYASRPDVREEYYFTEREQVDATIERQRRVRFVIVGGGATGVELCGELTDFFGQITRDPDGAFQHLKQDISVILVHGGNELLPQMDKDLRERALLSMQEQGIQVILNTRLKEVGKDFVKIAEKGSDIVETIPVGLTVWAAGNEPVPFVKELLSQLPESAKGSGGRINVDRWLRCPTPSPQSFGSILVLGDVGDMEAESKYDPTPRSLPQTAQVAGQQGAYAARMLNRGYDLQLTPPKLADNDELNEFSLLRLWLAARGLNEAPQFTFLNLGLLAYVGGGKALNQVAIGEVPIFNYSGEVAFALWRSVYLTKQAATRNQALISFDWLRTEIFGRDITRL